jgi:uncharacterized protein with von Willebrand factor type A (vWA) domain
MSRTSSVPTAPASAAEGAPDASATARPRPHHRPSGGDEPATGPPGEATEVLAAASADERLRHTDLADLTADELATLRRLMADLPWVTPRRRSRRAVRHPRGRRVDLRATLRRARATGGDPAHRS